MQRVALISLHTSPLLQPGSGDSGGMNVYVREVASALAQAGVECTTYTRADRPGLRREVLVEPGHRVVHVAGRTVRPARRRTLPELSRRRSPTASCDHLARRRRRRRVHGNYWLSGVVGPPPQARARRAARRHVPHAGQGQGRGRRHGAGVARPGRGRGHRLQRRDLRQLPRGGAPVPPPLRRPGRAHRDRAAGRRARLLRARRPRPARARAVGLPVDRPVVLFVGRIQPLKAPDVAIRALAAMARHPTPMLVIVGGASGRRRRRRGGARAAGSSTSSASPIACGSSRRSRTTSCPATTAPPTWWSCRAAARASGSSPSRRRRAASRSSPARSAGCSTSSTTASPATSSTAAIPARFARAMAQLLDDPLGAAAMGAAAAVRARRFTWSFTAARLRRLYADLAAPAAPARRLSLRRDAPSSVAVSDRRSTTTPRSPCSSGRSTSWLAAISPGDMPVVEAIERGDGRRAPLVRAHARRGQGPHDGLAHARPAHAALRDLRDAGAGGERRRALRAPAAPQRAARRRPLLDRRRGRRVPARRAAASSADARPSSTASSARSTPRSSSASRRCCASASPAASRSAGCRAISAVPESRHPWTCPGRRDSGKSDTSARGPDEPSVRPLPCRGDGRRDW